MPFFQDEKITESFDSSSMTVVPVIASFNTKGKIKPLYVRIGEQSLKIVSCWFQNEVLVLKFHCKVQLDEYVKDIILIYHPAHFFWTVDSSYFN